MDVNLLSNGAIQACIEGHGPPKPRLQVINIKKIHGDNASVERYRLQLSDGIHLQPGMLATQLNKRVESGEIDKLCVIQVEKMIVNTIQNRRIIIIINLSLLHRGAEVGGMLGAPVSFENSENTKPQQQQHQTFGMVRPPQPRPQPNFGASPQSRPQSNFGASPQPCPQSNFGAQATRAPPTQAPPPTRPSFYNNSSANGYGSGSMGNTFDGSQLSERRIVPITSLSPYQNKWTIKVRITSKPNIRTYNNARGEGRVMSVEMVDNSGEIRGTGFNEDADRLASIFQANKVYYVSRGRIKPANRQFTTCNNDYEMTFGPETQVEECFDNTSDLPAGSFNFTLISNLENAQKDALVDVIGVCISTGELTSVTTRTTNRKLSKRDLTLLDTSGKSITCTLWGSEAEGFDGSMHPVVAIKGARVSDFNGVSLSVLNSSTVHYDPDITESQQLKGWYESNGKDQNVTSLSSQMSSAGMGPTSFLSFKQIKELDLGRQEKPDYFSCKGMVIFLKKENCLYKACPSSECNKKVTEDGSGRYFCEKCNQNYPNFKYRIIMKLNCADFADNCWLDCFNEAGAKIIGMDGQSLGELKEQDESQFDHVIQESYFKEYIFRIRAKIDTYNDEQRLRCSCVDVQPLNYAQETHRLLEQIKEMMSS